MVWFLNWTCDSRLFSPVISNQRCPCPADHAGLLGSAYALMVMCHGYLTIIFWKKNSKVSLVHGANVKSDTQSRWTFISKAKHECLFYAYSLKQMECIYEWSEHVRERTSKASARNILDGPANEGTCSISRFDSFAYFTLVRNTSKVDIS
jgi:hypothetical protein